MIIDNKKLCTDFISAKKIEGCSDKTLTYYESYVERLLAEIKKPVQEMDTDDIRTFLVAFQSQNDASKVTVNNMRRILNSFFGWLEDEDLIGKSPMRRIKNIKTEQRIKETVSDEQMEILRQACANKRDLALVDFIASTGMRVGELVKLNRDDVDLSQRECIVFGKGNKERAAYFDGKAKVNIAAYLESRTDTNPALFVSLAKPFRRLLAGGVETRLRELGRKAGIAKIHPHKFRRTFATRAIDKGMPIEQVQSLLGHARIETTLLYANVNQANTKHSHRRYIG